MTHTTDPLPPVAAPPEPPVHRPSVRGTAPLAGAAAAGLGLALPAVAVLVLWIGSPYPDDGLGGALHIGAGLWLLAQGAELVRTATLSGDPAPIALTPLLLAAVPAWLVFRGTASAVAGVAAALEAAPDAAADAPDAGPRTLDVRQAAAVAGWVLAGYLAVTAVAAAYAARGPVHVDLLSVVLHVPLRAAAAAACGAWSGCGRPPLATWLRLPLPPRYADEAGAALRAAGAGGAVLLGGGALVGAGALLLHGGAVTSSYARLSGPWSGRVAVLLLALALVPNLAVWAASYALGAGFTVGAGSLVAPTGASGHPLLPAFPLLAALPAPGPAGVLGWATLAVPLAAAAAVAWSLAAPGSRARSWGGTLRTAFGAAALCGIAAAAAAAAASGALGHDALGSFGPLWWRTAAATTAWLTTIALPLTLLLRLPSHPTPSP